MKLKKLVQESSKGPGRVFDITIQALIILSLITFSISTIPDLSERVLLILSILEIVTVVIFSIEYILRIYAAEKKLDYILSFYGIIDLLAILPFYLSTAIDLRSIRVLRLFRLFRIFKIVRYNAAIKTFKEAFVSIKEELTIFSIATFFVIYIAAVGIYYFENAAQPESFKSVFHSLWWAVATLTTVGYGDIYPITLGGRIFTFVILMVGLSIVSIPAGLLASSLQEGARKSKKESSRSGETKRPDLN